MECNKEYRFKFSVKNPGCPQSGKNLTVESTNLDSHVAIASTPMTWRNESYMPMFTHTPNFTRTGIIFSTDIPCGDNNVDVELSMNVPVFTGFIFTILGLPTKDKHDRTDVRLSTTDDAPCYSTTGFFNGTSKSLVFNTVRDIGVNESCSFSFNMTNALRNSDHFVIVQTRMCATCLTQKNLGSARNLFTDRLNLTFSSIGQSSSYPCDENTISIRIDNIFNIHKNCDPMITVSGLINTRSNTSSLSVLDLVNGGRHLGKWDQKSGTLILDLGNYIVTQERYAKRFGFQFVVVNPPKEQDCVKTNVTIQLLHESTVFPLQARAASITFDNVTFAGDSLFQSQPQCPLQVSRMNFTYASISQNHSIPCETVTISVEFSTDVPLLTECPQTLRICGLDKSTTTPSSIWSSLNVLEFGGWNQTTKCLTMNLVQNTIPEKIYQVQFQLTHGAGVSPGLKNIVIISDFFRTQKTMNVSCAKEECTPMAVSPFKFSNALSAQTSTIPCDNNTIIVSLVVNMPVFCDLNVTFGKVAGTSGTPASLPVRFLAPGVAEQQGAWASDNLTAGMPASVGFGSRADIENRKIVFEFTIYNQKMARDPSALVWLRATFSTPNKADATVQIVTQSEFGSLTTHPTQQSLIFSKQGLVKVQDISFTLREIEQSNPFPCAENQITVTLVSDTDLKARCSPVVTVTGLTGSLSPTKTISLTQNENNRFNSTAKWSQGTGELIVALPHGSPMNEVLIFSFNLVNPAKASPAVQVSVRTWSSWQNMTTSKNYSDLDGIYEHNTTYKDLREHNPLHVRGLMFDVKHIGQSNPHPGCLNTISVTVQVNLPLSVSAYCHPKVVISVLSNAEHPSGRILLNSASDQCAASANSDLLFQEKVDGVRGYGMWNNVTDRLELWTANAMFPGQPYVFSFQLTNPMTGPKTSLPLGQKAQNVMIFAEENTSYPGGGKLGIPSYPDLSYTSNDRGSVLKPSAVLMTQDEGTPCCLCDIEEGDARPLKVKVPNFCVKRIGQASTTPCQINTLTITIASTAKLIKGDSVITLSQMNGVLSPIQGDTVLLLIDGTFGQDHDAYFADSPGGAPGRASWNQTESKMRLYLIKDIECGSDIVISFKILNPGDCTREPITVKIEADSTKGKAPVIPAADMYSDVHSIPPLSPDGTRGDAAPLKIKCLAIQVSEQIDLVTAQNSSPLSLRFVDCITPQRVPNVGHAFVRIFLHVFANTL